MCSEYSPGNFYRSESRLAWCIDPSGDTFLGRTSLTRYAFLVSDAVAFIAEEMARRGWSQRMLAMRSGVNHATISRLLAGERDPLWTTATELLRALGASVEIHGRDDPV